LLQVDCRFKAAVVPREAHLDAGQAVAIWFLDRHYGLEMPMKNSTAPSILVVEDELLVLMLTESILMEAGYETFTASDVSQALAHLRSNADIDVLFTDISLRSVANGGLAIARKAVRLRPSIHVVYASARPVTDRMRNGFVQGSRFLAKPYRQGQVLAAVGQWDHVEGYVAPSEKAMRHPGPNHRPFI
jgi:CheY-like chemotaxis protein